MTTVSLIYLTRNQSFYKAYLFFLVFHEIYFARAYAYFNSEDFHTSLPHVPIFSVVGIMVS